MDFEKVFHILMNSYSSQTLVQLLTVHFIVTVLMKQSFLFQGCSSTLIFLQLSNFLLPLDDSFVFILLQDFPTPLSCFTQRVFFFRQKLNNKRD